MPTSHRARQSIVNRLLALAAALIATTGAFAANASAAPFVFVSNTGDGSVSQFDTGVGGALTPNSPASVATADKPFGIAVSPDGKSAYVADVAADTVSQFDVAADGALSPKTPATVATGNQPVAVAVSPDGGSVYVTDDPADTVSQFDVGAGGVLSPKAPATVATGRDPQGVAVSPDGGSVYIVNEVDATVSQFDVGPGGVLTPKIPATVATGRDPNGIAVSPDGSNVYVTNEVDQTVSEFDVGAGGMLAPKNPATVQAGAGPFDTAVSPDGKSVYVTNASGTTVSEYDVGAGGVLSPKNPATVASGGGPLGVVVSPDGTSVYVTGTVDNTVSQFDVRAGGVLAPKTPPTVATGSDPIAIAVRPPPFVLGLSTTSGSIGGGTSVTITGTGFRQGDTVQIGQGSGSGPTAIPASDVTVVSSTEITATTGGPAHQGTYNLFVVDPDAVSAANQADRFTYTGGPVISLVSPASGPSTGGTGFEILGSGFTQDATVKIGQGNGDGPTAIPTSSVAVISPNQIVATTAGPAKPGSFNVFVTDAGGTSPASSADQFTYTGPTVSAVSPSSGPVTGGTPITITGTAFAPGATVKIGQGNGAGSNAITATNVNVVSPTQITATTSGPAKPGTWNVFVTGARAASPANGADHYTYTTTTPVSR